MNMLSNISWRALLVWRRNFDVSRVTWKTDVVPPALEPVMYIVAFGLGLGGYVSHMSYRGGEYDYITFIAPGMVMVGVLFHSMFESMYGSFVRMQYQKTYDAIIATPLTLEDVLAGELLWGATKGFFAGMVMLAVVSCFKLVHYPTGLLLVPLFLLAGLLFSGFGLLFTAISPTIDALTLPTFLFINPMFLFSGTFFPLTGMPVWAIRLAWCLPLTHVVDIARAATTGRLYWGLLWNLLYLLVLLLCACGLAMRRMLKRLVK